MANNFKLALILLVFQILNLQSAQAQERQGFSRRHGYGPQYFTSQPTQTVQGGYGYEHTRPPAASTLQNDFLSLFSQQGVDDLAARCSPRVVGDLSGVGHMCPRNDFFFGMNPRHIDAVQTVSHLMSSPSTPDGNICVASQLKHSRDVNPSVWMRSLMGTVLHNSELRGLHRPSLVEVFPSMVVHSTVMNEVRRVAALPPNLRGDSCIVLDGSFGTQNGPENALWYWREDVMLNAHHWYWHLANPFLPMVMPGQQQPPARPDRRGELFSYFHQSLLARYHSERLSNGLKKVVPLNIDYNTVIQEPYYANLDGSNSGQRWGDRPPNTRMQDVFNLNRVSFTPMNISIAQRNLEVSRILESVSSGRLITPNGEAIMLNNRNGIDFLGELVEASVYSVNPAYYGAFGVHNSGHILIALAHDPNGRLRMPPGVMADSSTAMRDPIFFRFHNPIAKILDSHKHYLPTYHPTEGEFQLIWPGVSVDSIRTLPQSQAPNELTTYWNQATYDLARGLDFNRTLAQGQGGVNVCVKHLDYEHFDYEILIKRAPNVRSDTASIRIFMAPSYDEDRRRYTFYDQRTLFFVMDYFTVKLQPGDNVVRRRSIDSSLTISWPQRLDELERDERKQMPDCGCGFPQHLLLPKGTSEGMLFDLFVMATNADEDAVPAQRSSPQRPPTCIAAPIYCGIPGQLYPDAKPMGFPFDRLPYSVHDTEPDGHGGSRYNGPARQVYSIQEYVSYLPNAALTQVRIRHLER